MSQNLPSAVVVIGALRVNCYYLEYLGNQIIELLFFPRQFSICFALTLPANHNWLSYPSLVLAQPRKNGPA